MAVRKTLEKKSPLARLTQQQILYTLLLVATFLIGYLLATVQLLKNPGSSVLGVGGGAVPTGQQAAPAPQGKVDVAKGHLPVLGEESAKVTIVEFSDFQCPFCEQFFTNTFPSIKKDYIDTGKVKMYFRHFPLDFHPAAVPAGIASECANDQDRFWDYHDKVFTEQAKISVSGQTTAQINDQLRTWAIDLGLNIDNFNTCLDDPKTKEKVTNDQKDGATAGVSGTPTFYINGTQLVGAQPYTAFQAAIDAELK